MAETPNQTFPLRTCIARGALWLNRDDLVSAILEDTGRSENQILRDYGRVLAATMMRIRDAD